MKTEHNGEKTKTPADAPSLSAELDAVGAIELDDAMLNAEVQGGASAAAATTSAAWVCNPSICCEVGS